MTPERWRQVTELFHAAIARPAAERSQYLDDACAGDTDLRAEVGAMLAAHADAGVREVPAVSIGIDGLELEPGGMVGPYEVHALIAAGGMGRVYRARDSRLDREVAIKVLPSLYAADGARLRRFEQGPVRAERGGARAIEGVWGMSLTLRDCATGAPLGPPFRSLLTFHTKGTLSESAGTTQFAAGQRSPGHGVWSHTGGKTFAARFVAMILFDTPPAPPAPGFQTGWLVVGSNFTLIDADRLAITATAQFFDINMNQYRSACPTGTAERFH